MTIPTTAVAATGWSEFWGGANLYATAYDRSGAERALSQVLARSGFRANRAIMRALNGVAPGATALATHTRVPGAAPFDSNVGNVIIETVTDVNRATAAGDVTYINDKVYDMVPLMQPTIANYAVDLSGNGYTGYAKVGF